MTDTDIIHLVKPDIFGTLTYWQCGHIAGGVAASAADEGDTCLEARDFVPGTDPDYIAGFIVGWRESPFTVAEITFGTHGPAAPVYVRGYASKAALNRAIRAAQCEGI